MDDIFIIGVGMTPFGRFLERSLTDLTEQAVNAALADAGLQHTDVGAIAFANATQGAMEGQFGIRGQVAMAKLPFDAVPIVNVENACASASTSLAPPGSQSEASIFSACGWPCTATPTCRAAQPPRRVVQPVASCPGMTIARRPGGCARCRP